ncbi:hypothetical protein AK88_03565 [Plasmodium fragile]|nr:uncharacterized protein AK88_03565 [Plasmodium fragile]KJP86751.1 hypothetical protein AK88_03565 [Plasmodium fragile]
MKLYMSFMKKDKDMTNMGYYFDGNRYGNKYGTQHLNSSMDMRISPIISNEKDRSQYMSRKNANRGPVLYGLLDDEQGANLRLKGDSLYKKINVFDSQMNNELEEEYDEDEFSDDDSEYDLEDDDYEDDYHLFDDDDEDDKLNTYEGPNRNMRTRGEKMIKAELPKDVNKPVTTDIPNELKEFLKNGMDKNVFDEWSNHVNLKPIDTTQNGSENTQLTLNEQIVQSILKDEVVNRAEANTQLINLNAWKDVSQLNSELNDAKNKHKDKKNEHEQKATEMRQLEEEINEIQKQIENVEQNRNVHADPNEEYRHLFFLYPQNKMVHEEEKKGLLMELQHKYKIKVEEKQNLLDHMHKVKNEMQRAADQVIVLCASIIAKEQAEKHKEKVNQPSGQQPSLETKAEEQLPNMSNLLNSPQVPPTPSLASLRAQLKGACLPAWVEELPEQVKISILSDLQQKLGMMDSKINPQGENIEQHLNYAY